MNTPNVQTATVLITGANTGIGKDVARQLATSGQYKTIYLACRSLEKAQTAKADLEEKTGGNFKALKMDMCDSDSVRNAVHSLTKPITDLIMNAGGFGDAKPFGLTKDSVTELFASNVLGHVVLLDEIVAQGKLAQVAVFASSEAARGVPALGIKRPALKTHSVGEFVSICTGKFFRGRKMDIMSDYGVIKYVGALWMSHAARQYPHLRLTGHTPRRTSVAASI
jgi:NAD(P)-dependent dehydrogenase (short-subunit alcohol dehydrogenase family)